MIAVTKSGKLISQIELKNTVDASLTLLLFACAELIHSAAQERKAKT